MVELPLDQVPRDGEIVEVFYRLSHTQAAYVDLTMSAGGGERRLRFNGARMVVFREQTPDSLLGLDVRDVTDQPPPPDTALWVSVADGAITFWAKSITELTRPKFEPRDPPPDTSADAVPLVRDEQVQNWGPSGVAPGSFRYQSRALRGVLRSLVINTEPQAGSRHQFKGWSSQPVQLPDVRKIASKRSY
jgi:hypothetical protein